MIDHDVATGPIERCQVCHGTNLEQVVDLGHQPLCDSLRSEEELNQPEQNFPLRLHRCLDCSLAQIDHAVDGSTVYFKEYPYRSGVTLELVEYQKESSAATVSDFAINKESLVVDVGSNDGTLLNGFKAQGMRVLGVEPTNIAKIANEAGIETIQSFFTEEVARDIVKDYGNASVVTATNMYAHMTALGEVTRGIEALLDDDGIFVCEVHYLLEIIRSGQYDTIYHEHLRSYSLKSLITLLEMYNFTVVDARQVNRYGGSLRVYAQKGKNRVPRSSVAELLKREADFGLYESSTYQNFRQTIENSRRDFVSLALEAKAKGQSFVGNSCPGRSSTLLNYCGIDKSLMPYIAEQPTSLKLGQYLPGMHIPIVDNEILVREQPDYVVLLAWHYAEPISKQLRERGLKSKLVMPLPTVQVLE
jgi:hypothetical protein